MTAFTVPALLLGLSVSSDSTNCAAALLKEDVAWFESSTEQIIENFKKEGMGSIFEPISVESNQDAATWLRDQLCPFDMHTNRAATLKNAFDFDFDRWRTVGNALFQLNLYYSNPAFATMALHALDQIESDVGRTVADQTARELVEHATEEVAHNREVVSKDEVKAVFLRISQTEK